MVQTSLFWLVLAGSVGIHWLLPVRFRLGWLTLVSLGYLATLDPGSVVVLVGWALLFYALRGRIAKDDRLAGWLVVGLVACMIGYLGYYKYLPGLMALMGGGSFEKLLVPLGISFFTFKLIHFAIETQRGTFRPYGFLEYAGWITLFTTFTAGPIERFDHFLDNREEKASRQMFAEGLTRIAHGLIKKFLLGLQLVPLLYGEVHSGRELLEQLPTLSALEVWRFLIIAFFLLYLDFSAYSDIAIGTSRLFGLRIMENFNLPILATNPAAYWKRWHMTLSGWCQSYIYMPVLMLSRNPYLSVFACFAIIGIWHGGNWHWLAWGLYHGAAVALFQAWDRYRKKKRWTVFDKPVFTYAGVPLTILYTSVAGAFTTIQGVGAPYDGLRIVLKLGGVDLPV